MVSTRENTARLRAPVTMRYNDSGVVIRKFGGDDTIAWRSAGEVSPVRTAAVNVGNATPISAAVSQSDWSGPDRLCSMSTASALRGET